MERTPKVSIIIPIYNAEQHLRECLESIKAQSYKDFEVILVDDGSTDGSAAICGEYVNSDCRFHYIYKENGGVSSARNLGICKAKGEWIHFGDADDTHTIQSMEILSSIFYNDNKIDMAMGSYIIQDEEGNEKRGNYLFELCFNRKESINILFLHTRYGYQGYLWNKLFRTNIIKHAGLHFNEQYKYNEDRLFCLEYICAMKGCIHFSSRPVYIYRLHTSSTMRQVYIKFDKNIYDDYNSSVLMLEILRQHKFPHRTINLAKDRILDSYDLIRHNIIATKPENASDLITELKQKAIRTSGGVFFYACNRVRRFLSKQIGHFIGRNIYIESLP